MTWGKSWNRIYDHAGNQVGWKPFATFDLNEISDSLHCIYKNAYYDFAEGELCYSIGYSSSIIDSISLTDEKAIFNAESERFQLTCFLHDIGHLLLNESQDSSDFLSNDLHHETVAYNFLKQYFPDDITRPIL